jgi:hypothetical protein
VTVGGVHVADDDIDLVEDRPFGHRRSSLVADIVRRCPMTGRHLQVLSLRLDCLSCVNQAILVLERNGPAEGRPLVDTVTASRIANMKELRPPSARRSEIRVLLVFDPWRSVVLLVAGDKSGQWKEWYPPRSRRLSSSTPTTWPNERRRWDRE